MKTPIESSVMQCVPTQASEQLPDANLCPQCQQPNHCDIANGSATCWCFELEVRDVGPKTDQQKNISAKQCLCRQCLDQVPAKQPSV